MTVLVPCEGCKFHYVFEEAAAPEQPFYCRACKARIVAMCERFDYDPHHPHDECQACGHERYRHHYGAGAACRTWDCRCLRFIPPPSKREATAIHEIASKGG